MTSTRDRQHALELVNEARASGARLKSACAELGIGVNTYRRWSRDLADKRPTADRPTPAHALSEAERQAILDACHRADFASLPPAQIVTRLLDEEGTYIASESSFYRVLRAANEQHHRGRAAPPRAAGPPQRHEADGPNQVWTYDVERHEALSDRATVRDRRDSAVAAAGDKLRAARTGERQQGWQAALTKPGHGSIVRCRGSGEQTRKV